MTPELLTLILTQLASAVGVYGAIRADLREALVRCTDLERRMDALERKPA